MPSTDDLRATLEELAHSARDVPDMALTRAVPRRRAVSQARPALLVVGLLVVLLGLGLGVGRYDLLPLGPGAGPTRAVPPAVSPSPSRAGTAPTTSPTPAPSPGRSAGPTTRPMTRTEITTQTATCLNGADDLQQFRRGELQVGYAMVQPAVGYPSNSAPRRALLLEDADGYYDCSGEDRLWVSKGGDEVDVDRSVAGMEVPTITGGSATRCDGPRKDATVDSVVVLTTSDRARTARVTVRAAGGTRTATLPTRDGHVYVAVRVSGGAAWQPSTFAVELLDARGHRLPVQSYAGSVTDRLTYPLEPCTRAGR
jgi:hypothetical protein